jgi:hypothetical protein
VPDNTVRVLVPSTNRGRYALDDPQYGADLTSGMRVSVWLGGYWAKGSIEHDSRLGGYYFIASDGSVCGLCSDMQVRLL